MRQAIVICHHHENKEFLDNLLKSLKGVEYPVVIVINDFMNADQNILEELEKDYEIYLNKKDEFELGAIRRVLKETEYDEFFFMQDSCEVKNNKVFDILFKKHKGKSIAIGYKFLHYLGKYRREFLEKISIPETLNKEASIFYESNFNKKYRELDPDFIAIGPQLRISDIFEKKCGRLNMKLENEYFIKWKGTWSVSQLKSGNNKVVEIIVVTTGKKYDFEENCLKSVKEFTDYPYALTEFKNTKNEGLSKIWNRLIKESKAEFICLLNSDTIVEQNWLRNMVKYFKSDIGAIGPVTNNAGVQQKERGIGIEEVDTLSGFCLLFPKKIWEEIGGFDEQFYLYFEDTDFCRKIKEKGYKFLMVNDVFIKHIGQASVKAKKNFDWRKEYKKSERIYKEKWK